MVVETTYTNNELVINSEIRKHLFKETYWEVLLNTNRENIHYYTKSILYKVGGEVLLKLYKENIPLNVPSPKINDIIFVNYTGTTVPVILTIIDKNDNIVETVNTITISSIAKLDKLRSKMESDSEFMIGNFLHKNQIYFIEELKDHDQLNLILKLCCSMEGYNEKHNLCKVFFNIG